MIGIESIKYSLRNLKQRKSRSFLTIFSIFVGIATIFIFVSFGYGLYATVQEFTTSSSADKVLVMAKGIGIPGLDDTFKLTDDDLDAIKRAGGVYEVTGVYAASVEVEKNSEKKYIYIASYDPKKPLLFDLFNGEIIKGRELKTGDNGAIFGYNYLLDGKIFAKKLEINDKVSIDGKDVKVIGFMKEIGNPQDDSQIYLTNDRFLEILPEKESYAEIIARVDMKNINLAVENIEKNLRRERGLEKGKEDFFVQSFEDLVKSYSGVLNIVIGFVILIALISILVSAVNTANTMITSVLERYKEIGVLKAIGARNSEIFGIFLFESSFLGFIAGLIGVLLGFILSYAGGQILAGLGWSFLKPYYSFWLFAGCVLFALITGGISGVIPAIKASRTNTVDALRYE